MKKITYVGPIPEGQIECPKTGARFPFKRGQSIEVPLSVAVALESQSPADWKVSDAVEKAAKEKA
jgi:hypothetical protein